MVFKGIDKRQVHLRVKRTALRSESLEVEVYHGHHRDRSRAQSSLGIDKLAICSLVKKRDTRMLGEYLQTSGSHSHTKNCVQTAIKCTRAQKHQYGQLYSETSAVVRSTFA